MPETEGGRPRLLVAAAVVVGNQPGTVVEAETLLGQRPALGGVEAQLVRMKERGQRTGRTRRPPEESLTRVVTRRSGVRQLQYRQGWQHGTGHTFGLKGTDEGLRGRRAAMDEEEEAEE